MRCFVLFTLLFLGHLTMGVAQQRHVCGNSTHDLQKVRERLIANKAFLKKNPTRSTSRNATTYIPVKFHLVAKDDGSDRVALDKVLDQFCLLNDAFAEFDIAFYLKDGFNFIDDTRIYEEQTSGSTLRRMRDQQDFEAMNIWIVGEVSLDGGNGDNIILGRYEEEFDWVLVRNAAPQMELIGIQGYTLLHEIGHYFGLLHPFFGWETQPYDETLEGKPAPQYAPSVDYRNGKRILNEFADGRNCEVAGDMICDTPADYYYASYKDDNGVTVNNLDNSACKYTRTMLDPSGERLKPEPSLIMGYFLDQCMDYFTAGQVDLMQADLASSNRSFLRNNYNPANIVIDDVPTLVSPIDRVVTDTYNQVRLTWQSVNKASGYLVEISKVPGFNDQPLTYISNTTSVTVGDLDSDRTYFWRVMPFNESFTCASPSKSERFKTGLSTAVPTLAAVDRWSIFPNPSTEGQALTLTVEAKEAFDANIEIFSSTGQVIWSQKARTFAAGLTKYLLPTKQLGAGLFFIQVKNEQGILSKKVMIF